MKFREIQKSFDNNMPLGYKLLKSGKYFSYKKYRNSTGFYTVYDVSVKM